VTTRTTADKCGCEWAENAHFHDWLIRLEEMPATSASLVVAMLISDEDQNTFMSPEVADDWPERWGSSHFGDDPDDFERFVSQHNWSDPVAMSKLANLVSCCSQPGMEVSRPPQGSEPGGCVMTPDQTKPQRPVRDILADMYEVLDNIWTTTRPPEKEEPQTPTE